MLHRCGQLLTVLSLCAIVSTVASANSSRTCARGEERLDAGSRRGRLHPRREIEKSTGLQAARATALAHILLLVGRLMFDVCSQMCVEFTTVPLSSITFQKERKTRSTGFHTSNGLFIRKYLRARAPSTEQFRPSSRHLRS